MKWNFIDHPNGVDKQGIRDGDIETFDRFRYASVVRESIQNSLDAVQDEKKPVKVQFEFFRINKSEFSDLFSVINHLKACLDYCDNEADIELINEMIKQYKFNKNEIEILKITDSNTIGMTPDTLNVFTGGRNMSNKSSDSSAGSKGMGKAAYFCISYLRSIFICSKISSNNYFISQGVSRLSNHVFDGSLKYYKGFFTTKNSTEPNLDESTVHNIFIPNETGTSINILGLWNDEERLIKMKESILDNFWFAINDKKLEVEIIDKRNNIYHSYNKSTLKLEIEKIWQTNEEKNQFRIKPNPSPYYKVITEANEDRKIYNEKIPDLGIVTLVLSKGVNYPGRIAFFRKSRMLIFKESKGLDKGYCGVFYCDDENGNAILKKLENARHDEWSSSNWNVNKSFGRNVIKSINQFIQNCIVDYRGNNGIEEISIPSLNNYINLDLGKNRSSGKMSSPIIIKASPTSKKKPGHHSRNNRTLDIQSYATKNDDSTYLYNIMIDSKIDVENNLRFEILVGSDNERNSEDVKIPILTARRKNGGIFEVSKNTFTINKILKGNNHFEVTLDDIFKHSLIIREIEN